MKRILKLLGILVALVVVAAGVFLVPTIWFRPWAIDHFYSRVFLRFALRHPMLLSQLRILEPMGLDFHADDLDDFSMAFRRKEAAFVASELATLRSYDRKSMTPGARVSAEVLDWFLDDQRRGARFLFHDYPVNQLFGLQSQLPDFMINTHHLAKPKDAEGFVRRVAKFGTAIDQAIEGLRWRANHGIVPPRFVLQRVLEETRAFEAHAARDNPIHRAFVEKLAKVEKLEAPARDSLSARLEREIERTVRPAYRRLNQCLAELEARATDDAGVWKLPDGEAFYQHCLRGHTTTDLAADSIHALGLREVQRVHQAMREILVRQGLSAADPAAALSALGEDARFRFPPGDSGRAMILAQYRALLVDAEKRSQALFGLKPRARLEVARVPAFKEEGSPGAYYDAPSFDGARPGNFYVNLREPEATVRWEMPTLAYHEGVPGHHFQIALAMEQKGLPFFRRIIPFTAYAEGWALYSERLAYEHGFETNPWDSLGALQADLFRAARLVVDTGIHRKRWSREQAIDYMVRTTGMNTAEVTTEVERYIVSPGQACAYKVGQLAILGMRENARERLGSRFDLREFHDVVLRNGAVPLAILERLVNDWVEAKARQEG